MGERKVKNEPGKGWEVKEERGKRDRGCYWEI